MSAGNGNATNAETNSSQNQSGIQANLFAFFPTDSEISEKEAYLISLIKTSGKEKNYELIEYISDVNRTYAEVLVEQNCNGAMDTAYVYGTGRRSLDRFDGSTVITCTTRREASQDSQTGRDRYACPTVTALSGKSPLAGRSMRTYMHTTGNPITRMWEACI